MAYGVILSEKKSTAFKLDPRTKLMLLIVINITIFSCRSLWIMLMIGAIPLFLLFAGKKWGASLTCTASFILSAMANEYLVPITHGVVNIFVVMIAGMLYRLMPGLIMGYYLVTTTTVSEFVAAMERMRVTQKIVIPLSVMFRFFPTVGEEGGAIGDAMRMRGIGLGGKKFFKNPVSMLEYRMVPLLMSTVKIGDELSAASLTRGLGSPEKRTNICKVGLQLQDFVMLALGALIFVGYIMQ